MNKGKSKKSVAAGADYSKVIGIGLGVIGLVIVALLIVILAKTLRDEKKYTISYHSDDKLAPQIVEQSELEGSAIIDEVEVVNTADYITVEKALDAALKNAGLTREQVWDIDVELERKFGKIVYEVSFEAGQYEYEYYVDATTGEIVKSFKEIER